MSSERTYTDDELIDLLEKAAALGFSMEAGSELEQMTIEQIDRLVNQRH